MDTSAVVMLLGGLGLFLLGIHHLTDGLKGLAGDSLRRALQRLVSGRFSAVVSGALFTAVIQSSTAAILTVIGFVSAGLVTFVQAVGMIIGATVGTTSTLWLVALFGLRFRISAAALPMLGVGAFLYLIARGKTRSFGAILAGFGLIFTGIAYLQDGMGGISWNLEAFAGQGGGARWILAGIGVLMSIVMQSSTAAGATTLVALNAGSLTFEQGCAMPRKTPRWRPSRASSRHSKPPRRRSRPSARAVARRFWKMSRCSAHLRPPRAPLSTPSSGPTGPSTTRGGWSSRCASPPAGSRARHELLGSRSVDGDTLTGG